MYSVEVTKAERDLFIDHIWINLRDRPFHAYQGIIVFPQGGIIGCYSQR